MSVLIDATIIAHFLLYFFATEILSIDPRIDIGHIPWPVAAMLFAGIVFSLAYQIGKVVIPFWVHKIEYKDAYKRLKNSKILQYSSLFTGMYVTFVIIVFAMLLFTTLVVPAFPLLYATFAFGAFGVFLVFELHVESPGISRKAELRIRPVFDHSLRIFAIPVLGFFLLVVPVHAFVESMHVYNSGFALLMTDLVVLAIVIGLSATVSKPFFGRLEIQKGGVPKQIGSFFLTLLTVEFVNLWDRAATDNWMVTNSYPNDVTFLLFFSGMVPLRLANVFVPKLTIRERVFSALAVVVYVVDKYRTVAS